MTKKKESTKKDSNKKCSSKCSKKNCGALKKSTKKCNDQLPVLDTPVEIKQSKTNYFYGLIRKAFGYD